MENVYENKIREKMTAHMSSRNVNDAVEFEVCCVPREPQQAKAKGNLEDFLKDGFLV